MKHLFVIAILLLLPIAINAGVKFETAETDTVGTTLNIHPVTYAVITLDRIECDTSIWAHIDRGGYIEEIDKIVCDTVFRIKYESIRAPVYLDTLRLQKLLRILND